MRFKRGLMEFDSVELLEELQQLLAVLKELARRWPP